MIRPVACCILIGTMSFVSCAKDTVPTTPTPTVTISNLRIAQTGFFNPLCAPQLRSVGSTALDELTFEFQAAGVDIASFVVDEGTNSFGGATTFAAIAAGNCQPAQCNAASAGTQPVQASACIVSGNSTGSGTVRLYVKREWQPLDTYAVFIAPAGGVSGDLAHKSATITGTIARAPSLIAGQAAIVDMQIKADQWLLQIYNPRVTGRTLELTVSDVLIGNPSQAPPHVGNFSESSNSTLFEYLGTNGSPYPYGSATIRLREIDANGGVLVDVSRSVSR